MSGRGAHAATGDDGGGARRPEGGHAGGVGPASVDPPYYQGGQIHNAPDQIGIDWLAVCGPKHHLQAVERLFGEWGWERLETLPGLNHYAHRFRYSNGAELSTGHASERSSWRLELRGGVCTGLGMLELLRVGRELFNLGGVHGTRVDIRRDVLGDACKRVRLVDDVVESCKRGELCKVRRFKEHPEYSTDLQRIGWGVELGSRQSERYVRVYDKGLEQGTIPEGQWQRFEAQLRGDFANKALVDILTADDQGEACKRALGYMVGVVDFREQTGDPNLSRRPRPQWWEAFIDGCSWTRVSPERMEATFEGRVDWLARAVIPYLATVGDKLGGYTPGQVLDRLITELGVEFRADREKDFVVQQTVIFLKQGY